MKICLISASLYSPPTSTGGIESLVKRVSSRLLQQGHKVSIITSAPSGVRRVCFEEIEGVRVYSFYPLNIFERSSGFKHSIPVRLIYHTIDQLWNPQPYKVVRSILAKEMPDIVHIHNWRGFSPSLFDAIKSRGLPLILTVHDYSLVCPKSSLLRSSGAICTNQPLPCKLYKLGKRFAVDSRPDMVTTPSQFVIDKLREYGIFRNTKAIRLLNAIEVDVQQHINKDSDTIDIIYVGKLIEIKGVQVLIQAFKQLERSNARLHIIGDGGYAAELRRIAGADSRIMFHGFAPQEKLALLWEKASIAVVPSIWFEPGAAVIIESLKYGIPVVGSNIGGTPEMIENRHNGLLFESGNIEQLKNVLGGLIENPADLTRLSEGALESVKKYDINEHIVELLQIYEQIIR